MTDTLAGASPVDQQVVPLVARLRREAEAWDAGSGDMAALLREAADELHNLAWALSLPGFDRMATDEQESEHQAGVQRVNDMLARMEKAKAEHDAILRDAERYRFIRDADRSDDLIPDIGLYAMESLDDYVDDAMAEYARRHNVEGNRRPATTDLSRSDDE